MGFRPTCPRRFRSAQTAEFDPKHKACRTATHPADHTLNTPTRNAEISTHPSTNDSPYQYVARPPERSNTAPVEKLHSSEARNATSVATSSGWPIRFIGIRSTM